MWDGHSRPPPLALLLQLLLLLISYKAVAVDLCKNVAQAPPPACRLGEEKPTSCLK
jgi:hypothetical protein